MDVLVLGCGPAGLLAAHAASLSGHDVKIVSKKKKSYLNGCQYLHLPIPGLPSNLSGVEPIEVSYTLRGTPDQYRKKVYGNDYRGSVSPDQYADEDHLAWDLRKTYDELWDIYEEFVIDLEIVRGVESVLPTIDGSLTGGVSYILETVQPDIAISTIPGPLLCQDGSHQFLGEEIWAMGDAPGIDVVVPIPCDPATVVCDGTEDVSWYRVANVFDHKTVEWPWRDGKKPPIEGVVQVTKPLMTTCDCPQNVYGQPITPMGRYGKWQKGYLSHEAFFDTLDLLSHNGSSQMVLPGMEAVGG